MATHSGGQHSSVLAGESQGWGSLVGFHLRGRTELDTAEVTWRQQPSSFTSNVSVSQPSI